MSTVRRASGGCPIPCSWPPSLMLPKPSTRACNLDGIFASAAESRTMRWSDVFSIELTKSSAASLTFNELRRASNTIRSLPKGYASRSLLGMFSTKMQLWAWRSGMYQTRSSTTSLDKTSMAGSALFISWGSLAPVPACRAWPPV